MHSAACEHSGQQQLSLPRLPESRAAATAAAAGVAGKRGRSRRHLQEGTTLGLLLKRHVADTLPNTHCELMQSDRAFISLRQAHTMEKTRPWQHSAYASPYDWHCLKPCCFRR